MRHALPRVLGLLLAGLLAACDAVGPVNEPPPAPPAAPTALVALLRADGDFETFATVVGETGLEPGAIGPTTTLAPDDEAFDLMSPESLDGLRRQPGVLTKLARRHVVTAALDPAALSDGDALPTLEGTPLAVRVDDEGTVFVGGARLGRQVGTTPGGPVYRLTRVLRDHLSVAERLGASPLLSRSAALFAAAGVDLSRPGTYFVPVNVGYDQALGGYPAFARVESRALVTKTLRALVVPGEPLSADALRQRGTVTTAEGSPLAVAERDGLTVLGQAEARVLVADIPAGGATIHLIDVPPQGHLTLLERVQFVPTLSSFADLLTAAGVAPTLDGGGPFTVFATPNDAFAALGTNSQQALLGESALRDLVTRFQVSPQDIPAADLIAGRQFLTLSPQEIRIRPDEITGDPAGIARSSLGAFVDLPARNGRLHVVTGLLNPDVPIFDQLVLSGFGRFRELARRTGYEALLSSGTPVSVFAPRTLTNQALLPGFECRAQEIAGDHIASAPIRLTPQSGPFEAVGGGRLVPAGPTPSVLELKRIIVSSIDVTVVPIGQASFEFLNLQLADGSILHGLDGRLRWYASGGPAQNLPGC